MYGHANPQVRSTEEGEIVGPRMHRAVFLVKNRGPYKSKNALAKVVGPNGSQDYGYRIVNRCRKKGLIETDPEHPEAESSGIGAVVLTQKGERYCENNGSE